MSNQKKKLFEVVILRHEEKYLEHGRVDIESTIQVAAKYLTYDEEQAKYCALADMTGAKYKPEELEVLVRPF